MNKNSISIFVLTFLLILFSVFVNDNANAGFRQKVHFFIAINPGASDQRSQNPYNSSKITVPAESNLTWINNDEAAILHSIISGDPNKGPSNIFYSEDIEPGGQITIFFDKPGVYPYYDRYYPHMKGQVVVTASE